MTERGAIRRGRVPSSHSATARAESVQVTDAELIVQLADGRRLAVPLAWSPRLLRATPEQRARWELLGDGEGIHWPEVDEDVSIQGLLSTGGNGPSSIEKLEKGP